MANPVPKMQPVNNFGGIPNGNMVPGANGPSLPPVPGPPAASNYYYGYPPPSGNVPVKHIPPLNSGPPQFGPSSIPPTVGPSRPPAPTPYMNGPYPNAQGARPPLGAGQPPGMRPGGPPPVNGVPVANSSPSHHGYSAMRPPPAFGPSLSADPKASASVLPVNGPTNLGVSNQNNSHPPLPVIAAPEPTDGYKQPAVQPPGAVSSNNLLPIPNRTGPPPSLPNNVGPQPLGPGSNSASQTNTPGASGPSQPVLPPIASTVPGPPNIPPTPRISQQQPPLPHSSPPVPGYPNMPPSGAGGEPATTLLGNRQSSIAGRRQYPQQSAPQVGYQQPPLQAVPQPSYQPQPPTYKTVTAQPQGPAYQPQSVPYPQPNSNYTSGTYQQPVTNQQYNSGGSMLGGGMVPNHYPQMPFASPPGVNQMAEGMQSMSLHEHMDLLQIRNVLPPSTVESPKIVLPSYEQSSMNCSPEIFRCTLTKLPETQSLLQKSRLPLGILIHPFRDLTLLPVIQCNTIVRCRSCRTYINPFVYFVDQRRWKCNLCYRVNELPEEFHYDPVSKTFGDPSRRPEVRSATVEFIAPSEYMLRPPQQAVYLFVLDVSQAATETGYLRSFCDTLREQLDNLPGDSRTLIGFITFDSTIHFYSLVEGMSQPQMMIVSDIDDVFLPSPDNLLVNLQECKELVNDLLIQLPIKFIENREPGNCLGAALQAAYKLLHPIGGRITVLQTNLPSMGPGSLKSREDPNQRAAKEIQHLGPASDFYKKLSLDCSGQQIAVDLFMLSTQYADIATLSCISKYSGGSSYYYPGFQAHTNPSQTERFEKDLQRYLTRKIGFEAVMRIRCTRGLAIHTFHGNFFVRSTDLLSLPNINPDVGFAMQVSIEENLTECNTACFQAALLYTSSKGERRIRVHTLCLPVTAVVSDILNSADQQAVVGLLSKMAVDRCISSSVGDARDALINSAIDAISVFRATCASGYTGLTVPQSLRLFPMYVLALLKHPAFRLGVSTKLDERVFAMNQLKTLPLYYLLTYIYPNLYPVHNLAEQPVCACGDLLVSQPPLLHLSSEKVDMSGAYLLDASDKFILYVGRNVGENFCRNVLNVAHYNMIPDRMVELPELENPDSDRLRTFIRYLQSQRPFQATFLIIRDDSKLRPLFTEHLVEDRNENSFSYFEFLQHVRQQVAK